MQYVTPKWKRKTILVLSLQLTFCTSLVHSQDQPDGSRLFDRLDANRNGRIEKSEFDRPRLFGRWDTDGNGFIDRAEYSNVKNEFRPNQETQPESKESSVRDRIQSWMGRDDSQAPDFDSEMLDHSRGGGLREPRSQPELDSTRFAFPNPASINGSPSSLGHYGMARQASTWMAGPRSDKVSVQILDLEDALGKDVGTSPWHVVSTKRYQSPGAVTVWGATITDAYCVLVDGDRFQGLDRFQINPFPLSLPWNLVALDAGRVIVPDQDGFGAGMIRKESRNPSYLVLTDDPAGTGEIGQGITLEALVEMDVNAIAMTCGVDAKYLQKRLSFTTIDPTYTGQWAVPAIFKIDDEIITYMVMLDSRLKPITACLVDRGLITNARAAEPLENSQTAFYLATESALVKVVWNPKSQTLQQAWRREIDIRGRTGTTPTLLNTTSGEKFVILIEAQAAVQSVLNGLIVFSNDPRPSALIAVRREDNLTDGTPSVVRVPLPSWLTTVENSPAVLGDIVVVANYSGYLPNGLVVRPGGKIPSGGPTSWMVSPDAQPDFATGVVALQYDQETSSFRQLWADKDVQFSCVPAISGGANRVYGTGAETSTRKTYAYSYRLKDDAEGPAGERIMRAELGNAPFRQAKRDFRGNVVFDRSEYRMKRGEFFDQGNNIIVLEDGSLIYSGGRALARVR